MTQPASTLTVTVPPQFWLTQNRAIPNHHARRARVNSLHQLTVIAARDQGLATIPTPCKATWTIQYPKGTGPADPVNASPTTKACLDALVPVWLAKDDSKHVVSETFQRGPNLDVSKSHVVTLTIEEADATPQASQEPRSGPNSVGATPCATRPISGPRGCPYDICQEDQ